MQIPLFVSASGILAVIAFGFAFALRTFRQAQQRRYVHEWYHAWAAIGVYAVSAGLALLATTVDGLAPFRRAFSLLSILAAWWHLRHLAVGTRDLVDPTGFLPRWRGWLVALLMLSAIALLFWPASGSRDAAFARYVARVGVMALAWGTVYLHVAWDLARRFPQTAGIGQQTLAAGLILYAALRLFEPLAFFVGSAPALAQVLTFGGIPFLTGVGAGMLMILLEVEQARAVGEAEARVRAEDSRSDSEALLASALSSSPDPVLILDAEHRLLACNDGFAQMLRNVRGVDAVVGMDVRPYINAETDDFWRDAFPRALAGTESSALLPIRLTTDWPARLLAVRLTPVRRSAAIIGVLVSAHDATEEQRLRAALARREAWFRSMIEHASDTILQVSQDGRVEYVSPSIERTLGLEAEAFLETDAFDVIHPDDRAALRDAMERAFRRDDSMPTTVPFRARRIDGEYVPMEAVSRPFTDPDGTSHLIVSARDLRERLRLEQELLKARRLESVGRLAGGIAHDFNNLLTAVAGNITMLRDHVAPTGITAEHLDEASSAVQRGAELTRRLLAFARRQMVAPRVLDVAAQVRDLERLLTRLLGERCSLTLALADDLWAIRADPTSLEQILVNLIVNARDAMPSGGAVTLRARNTTVPESGLEGTSVPAGEWVRIDVSDTGTGMDAAILGQIFEPFFTTKDRTGGTGLGLATVYGAISQSGGYINVRSALGRGTTFSLFFPRVPDEGPSVTPASPTTLPRSIGGETILLVDDDPGVREVTRKLLAKLGYTVITAVDGQDGVAQSAAHEGPLALVVCDMVMPGLGGVETALRIRQQRPDVPVLFISGYSEDALQWKELESPPGPLLPKPFSVDKLATSVRREIDRVR